MRRYRELWRMVLLAYNGPRRPAQSDTSTLLQTRDIRSFGHIAVADQV